MSNIYLPPALPSVELGKTPLNNIKNAIAQLPYSKEIQQVLLGWIKPISPTQATFVIDKEELKYVATIIWIGEGPYKTRWSFDNKSPITGRYRHYWEMLDKVQVNKLMQNLCLWWEVIQFCNNHQIEFVAPDTFKRNIPEYSAVIKLPSADYLLLGEGNQHNILKSAHLPIFRYEPEATNQLRPKGYFTLDKQFNLKVPPLSELNSTPKNPREVEAAG